MASIPAFPVPSTSPNPSILNLMSTEAFDDLIAAVGTNEALRSQVEAAYQQLEMKIQALMLENAGLTEDAEALAAAFQRKTSVIRSQSLIFSQGKEADPVKTYFDTKNEKLRRENALLKSELTLLKAKFDMLTAKNANIEAEKQDLEGEIAVLKHNSKKNVSSGAYFPTKSSVPSSNFAEKEANRLLACLSAQKTVISAYKSQNLTLKDSRAELISHCQQLLSTAQSLQERVIGLDDSRRNSEFAAHIWKTQFEAAISVCKSTQKLQFSIADVLENYVNTGFTREQLLDIAKRLRIAEELPLAPVIEPERPLPQSFPVVAEPPIHIIEHLTRVQQEVVHLSERCEQLEESSGLLINRSLMQAITVLYRWKKAVTG